MLHTSTMINPYTHASILMDRAADDAQYEYKMTSSRLALIVVGAIFTLIGSMHISTQSSGWHSTSSMTDIEASNLRRPSIRDSRSAQPTCRQRRLVNAPSLAFLYRLYSLLIYLCRLGRRVREGRCARLVGLRSDQGESKHSDSLGGRAR